MNKKPTLGEIAQADHGILMSKAYKTPTASSSSEAGICGSTMSCYGTTW